MIPVSWKLWETLCLLFSSRWNWPKALNWHYWRGREFERNFPIKSYLLWKSNKRYQFKNTTLSSNIVEHHHHHHHLHYCHHHHPHHHHRHHHHHPHHHHRHDCHHHHHQWLEMVAQDWRRRTSEDGAGTGRRAGTRTGNGTDPKTRSGRKSPKKVIIWWVRWSGTGRTVNTRMGNEISRKTRNRRRMSGW